MKLIDPTTQENIRIAINSIKSHLLRTVLTVSIIACAIEYFLVENFTRMGSNTFTIKYQSMRMGGERHQANMNKVISWEEAIEFKKNYTFPSSISIYIFANGNTTVKFGSNKTYPNIRIFGADENYLLTSGETIEKGRNFSSADAWQGTHVAILGEAVAKNIFGETVDPLGKIVSVGPGKYMVIGILKSKGSSIGFSNDRTVILPIQNVRERFVQPDQSYSIAVMPPTSASMDAASGEAIGVFRTIRKL
ncbi:MAG TPA: ABC transporter permease, partial [Bacteroidales bacterium]|nr:ABC transporter permease [Bacteroidales bacterium]